MKKKKLIALPYIYPVCPLNFNHTKMFVVGDVLARHLRSQGYEVTFPVASHYTGNTAQSAADAFKNVFNGEATEKQKSTVSVYQKFYKTPKSITQHFTDADNILNFYTQEILWELHSLGLSCDFGHNYSTSHPDFSIFVRTIVDQYQKHGVLTKNDNGDLALNYDDPDWKQKATELIENTEFEQPFHRKNVLSARAHIRNDWEILRSSGFGVEYKNGLIIDPMFDSELFTIFDLYIIFKDDYPSTESDTSKFFAELFKALHSGEKTKNPLINKITEYLPCDIFVCEEHLKNWVLKKFYTESLLLHPKYRTKKFFVIGMGALDGKRMSASRGHAVLSKDLIAEYGANVARLILLLSGGNLSKAYNYDRNLPDTAQKMIDSLSSYLIWLSTIANHTVETTSEEISDLDDEMLRLEKLIQTGYFRQAVIELFTLIPKKYKSPDKKSAHLLLSFYEKYLNIFLPSLFEDCVI